MTASCFLDTNILVYSVDKKGKAKHGTARDLIATLVQNDDAIISTQTLQGVLSRRNQEADCIKEGCRTVR